MKSENAAIIELSPKNPRSSYMTLLFENESPKRLRLSDFRRFNVFLKIGVLGMFRHYLQKISDKKFETFAVIAFLPKNLLLLPASVKNP